MTFLLKHSWWKWLTAGLMTFTVVFGLLTGVPRLPILNESIRNLYFHVPMWFGMIFLFLASAIQAIKYLKNKDEEHDLMSKELGVIGILYGVLGLFTGMIWAKFTWGEPWSNDPKQNASAIALLLYFAYFLLRGSVKDEQQRARLSAVYNIFSFIMMIPLLFILPRLTDSLHPGNGGNPGFNAYDLDNRMRLVFYPAVIGWTLLGFWISTIRIRIAKLKLKIDET